MQFLSTPDCLVFRDFSWSPTDNKIAYWVPGRDSIPAKITIIEIPSRKEISTKSRHDVSEVGASCMAQPILVVVGGGWRDEGLWVVVGGKWVTRLELGGGGGGGGGGGASTIGLHFRDEYPKSHFLAYACCNPPLPKGSCERGSLIVVCAD